MLALVGAVTAGVFGSPSAIADGALERPAWIWAGDTPTAASSAPAGEVRFERTFELPADATVAEAAFLIGVDNRATVTLNGSEIGRFTGGWSPLGEGRLGDALESGRNELVIEASNASEGPAGLYFDLTIRFANGRGPVRIVSDRTWTTGSGPAAAVARNGDAPWGLVMPAREGAAAFPEYRAEGGDLTATNAMLARFHPAANIDVAGTYALAWLPRAMLWAGDVAAGGLTSTQLRTANRLRRMKVDADGYVSCHQHEGLAHSEGWPFPLPTQSGGFGFYFTLAGVPFGEEFRVRQTGDVGGWELSGATSAGVDAERGWTVELTEPNATVTSPEFSVDALVTPFVRVKWDAAELPAGGEPWLEWTTAAEPEFSAERRVAFPEPAPSSAGTVEDFNVPIAEVTRGEGAITRLRIGFGNAGPGRVTIQRVFSAVDSRHSVNNANYLIAVANYFAWTGDQAFLEENGPKLRRALDFLLDEFAVREAKLVRTPWIGHDGRSGVERTPEGKKIVKPGVGVGGNYWDLLPFGGDDVLATIYLHHALERAAELPTFAEDVAKLRELAAEVRGKFQATFWNPATGRFAPIDDTGAFRDYGFTFLNNEAIFYGLATEEQAREILAWQDGKRVVEGDTSTGADIYRWRFAPRATTRRNLDYYAYVWSNPEALPFGGQVQDGGAVLGFSYHDIMARLRTLGADDAWRRLLEIQDWSAEVEAAGGARAYYAEPGRGTLQGGGTAGGLGIDEEFYESVMLPSVVLDGFIGFEPTAEGFRIEPRLPDGVDRLGVSNVAFRGRLLDVEVTRDAVEVNVIAALEGSEDVSSSRLDSAGRDGEAFLFSIESPKPETL